jgi:dsRNA-specific ribonuclease
MKDETGIYKNLLQETAHRAGLNLPAYTTVRSGPGHVPVFTCTVELAGMNFTGEPAKTKKQAEKNAAIAAWSALKRSTNLIPHFLFILIVNYIICIINVYILCSANLGFFE